MGFNVVMDKELIQGRLRRLRKLAFVAGFEAVVLSSGANVRYYSGFDGDDSWLLVGRRDSVLITDSRYTERAQAICPVCRIYERDTFLGKAAGMIISARSGIKTVAVEPSISLGDFERLKKRSKKRVKGWRMLGGELRMVKDDYEVGLIAKAGRLASKALAMTVGGIEAGVSESYVAGLLDFNIAKLGCELSFETIVAFGANASMPHHKPGVRKLRKNDTILIDFGAKYEGYCSDITRCFYVGRCGREYMRSYEAVERAQRAAINKVGAGVEAMELDKAAREELVSSGVREYGHGLGHGVGLYIHERPVAGGRSKDVLGENMVLTIEPGTYEVGRFGIRIEDDVLVKDGGCEVLTRMCAHEPDLVKFKEMVKR